MTDKHTLPAPVVSVHSGVLSTAVTSTIFLGVWLAVTGADISAWVVGVPAALVAGMAASAPSSRGRAFPNPIGLARLAGFMAIETVRGTIDVARRVLAVTPDVEPRFVRFKSVLTQPSARTLFAYCLTLLPGTVASRLHEQAFEVHVLDATGPWESELRRLESHVSTVFKPTQGAA
jgi:multicomponent Na+:H+ antiporter subunit E